MRKRCSVLETLKNARIHLFFLSLGEYLLEKWIAILFLFITVHRIEGHSISRMLKLGARCLQEWNRSFRERKERVHATVSWFSVYRVVRVSQFSPVSASIDSLSQFLCLFLPICFVFPCICVNCWADLFSALDSGFSAASCCREWRYSFCHSLQIKIIVQNHACTLSKFLSILVSIEI